MTALHGLDIAAVVLVVVIGEGVLTAADVQTLGSPFVPPGQGDDLGLVLKGGEPLGVPEHTAVTTVGSGQVGHIGLLGSHGHADLLGRAVGGLGELLIVVLAEEAPLPLIVLDAAQPPHGADGVEILQGEGLGGGVGGEHEGLTLPVDKAVLPLLHGVVLVVQLLIQGAVAVAYPEHHVGGAQALGAHLHDGVADGVHGLLDVLGPGRSADVAVARVGEVDDDEVHARGVELGHMGADDVLIGAGVIAQRGLCPVVEGGRAAPFLLAGQDLGDVVPVVHGTARLAQDGVEPNRVADGDQARLVGDVQAQAVALGGSGGNGLGGHGLALGGRVQVQIIDLGAAAAVDEQGVMLTLERIGGTVGFSYHFVCLIVYTDLAIGEENGTDQSGGIGPLGGDVDVGGIIGGGDDVHVMLAVQHPRLQLNSGPGGRPGVLIGMVDLHLTAGGIEGDPQAVPGAVGDLECVVADVAAPHGVQPRAVPRRDDGPVHGELSLLVILDGGGGVGSPGGPRDARQSGGIGVKGRIQHAVAAVGGAGGADRGVPAAGGIVIGEISVEGVDDALLPRLHELAHLVVGIGGVDLGVLHHDVIHDTVVELTGILLPALQLLGGGLGGGLVGSRFVGRRFVGRRLFRRFLGGSVAGYGGVGVGLGVAAVRGTAHEQAQAESQAKGDRQPQAEALHTQLFHRIPHFREGVPFQDNCIISYRFSLVKSISQQFTFHSKDLWSLCTTLLEVRKNRKFFRKIFQKPLDKIPSPWYNMQAL